MYSSLLFYMVISFERIYKKEIIQNGKKANLYILQRCLRLFIAVTNKTNQMLRNRALMKDVVK